MDSTVAERAARPEETWRLEDIYPDPASFDRDRSRVEAAMPSLEGPRGRLHESAAMLRGALDAATEQSRLLSRLHTFAHMRADEDTRIADRRRLQQEIEILFTEFGRRIAWMRPEILALPEGVVERFVAEDAGLGVHAHFLRDLLRQKPHVLTPAEEKIVAEAGLVLGGPNALFGILQNAEMPRPEVEIRGGERVRLTPAAFALRRASPVRGDRRAVFQGYFGSYVPFRETLGANLFECLKAHVFRSRVRRYPSCVAAALDGDNVPVRVYTNLIARIRESLPVLFRYYGLRARALGIERPGYHDLHCPLAESPRMTFPVSEAKRLVADSMEPLGPEYGEAMRRALAERWIDWHPWPGKRSGAYAAGSAYDVHPYMLLNYNGDFDSVSTLAHEAGHALHSWFSNRSQPFATASYSIFVAEVASTFNEALLAERMLGEAKTREERIFLIAQGLDHLRATLFRQTFFAEFELRIHERAEAGDAWTGETLTALYLELLREHQGHAASGVDVEDLYGIEWACVPHFYYDFYVDQYATGIVAATSLAEAVLEGRPGARDRYLGFLRAGGSDYPLEILRRAGVDLETSAPYEAVVRAMDRRLDELEALLDGRS